MKGVDARNVFDLDFKLLNPVFFPTYDTIFIHKACIYMYIYFKVINLGTHAIIKIMKGGEITRSPHETGAAYRNIIMITFRG